MARITNSDELNESFLSLMTQLSLPEDNLGNKLNSTSANNLFTTIQNTIDSIYEKLRLLEDVHDFTRKYIQNEFQKNKNAIDNAVHLLEKASDLYQDTENVAHTAKFQTGNIIFDRDGTPIYSAETIDGNIIIPGNKNLSSAEPATCVVSSNSVSYRQIKMPPSEYRSFYALETPEENGIQEEIHLIMTNGSSMNFFHLSAFGCNISDLSFMLKDGSKLDASLDQSVFSLLDVEQITFKLKSTSVEPVTAEIEGVSDTFNEMYGTYATGILDTMFSTYISQKGTASNVYK